MNLQNNFFLKFVFYYHCYSSLNMWDLLKIYLWFRCCRCIKVKISHPWALLPAQPSNQPKYNSQCQEEEAWVMGSPISMFLKGRPSKKLFIGWCFKYKRIEAQAFKIYSILEHKVWTQLPHKTKLFQTISFDLVMF